MNKLYEKVKNELLGTLKANVGESCLEHYSEDVRGSTVLCTYLPTDSVNKFTLTADIGEEAIIFYINAECESGFAPQNSVSFTLGSMKPEKMLGSFHSSEWWMYPCFPDDFSSIPAKTQSLFIKNGVLHYHVLPLCGDNFRCELEAGKLSITPDMSGLTQLSGAFLAVSVSTDPFTAAENSYSGAAAAKAISVPLVNERKYPEMFEGFGWCTWDAFYHDVTADGIFAKLDEFKEKGIPVSWLIIDDGWLSITDGRLSAFEANANFPNGLKAAVSEIKERYGIKYVGVWHAFHGYWEGVCPDSALEKAMCDDLDKMKIPVTKPPYRVPSLTPQKAEHFWNTWYSYLKECGIDFVKVDNQSASSRFYRETMPTTIACRNAHTALEAAIQKHFDGVVINCMGMDMENVLARPISAVSRNSDDFYPNRERNFISHLTQNVYNAIWHGRIYHCDFDMWWSGHPESAVQSGVLRAISGSPVYVSDKVGESEAANILPIIEDGKILRCDCAARPTYDCFYTDCRVTGQHLKIWNRSGNCFAAAAFNLADGECKDSFDFGMIPELSHEHEYIAYEYFSAKFSRVNFAEDTEISLLRDGCAVWSLYPIESDEGGEYIMLGDTSKYVSAASKKRAKTYISSLDLT